MYRSRLTAASATCLWKWPRATRRRRNLRHRRGHPRDRETIRSGFGIRPLPLATHRVAHRGRSTFPPNPPPATRRGGRTGNRRLEPGMPLWTRRRKARPQLRPARLLRRANPQHRVPARSPFLHNPLPAARRPGRTGNRRLESGMPLWTRPKPVRHPDLSPWRLKTQPNRPLEADRARPCQPGRVPRWPGALRSRNPNPRCPPHP